MALPSAQRDNLGLAVDTPAGLWLIDCGNSVVHRLLRLGLDPSRLRGVFLSHNHADHISGLPTLLFHLKLAGMFGVWSEFRSPIDIYGNPPTVTMARCVLHAYRIEVETPAIRWHELPAVEGHTFAKAAGIRWFSTPVVHSRPTLAVKAEVGKEAFAMVYSADTEPCESLIRLATEADLLVYECSAAEPMAGHSTPQQAGLVAARAGVKRLLVVHYDPAYVLPVDETRALIRKGGFGGEILFAEDGMALPLRADPA
jgi:ribonuclease Z